MRVQSPGWEDPLEKGMVTYSCILAWTEEPGGLQSIRLKSRTRLSEHTHTGKNRAFTPKRNIYALRSAQAHCD